MADSASSPIDSASSPIYSAPPAAPPSSSGRRLPPPCWSHDETVALIDSYRDKWYSLRRSNLKADHWQEVADAVSHRCPAASPAKTAVQCRHKMEKLRKRYRTDLQRSRSMPASRFNSSWVHFHRMAAMDMGSDVDHPHRRPNSDSDDDDNDDDGADQVLHDGGFRNGVAGHKLYPNSAAGNGNGNGGFRIRIPTGVSIAQPGSKFYGKIDHKFIPNATPIPNYSPSPNFGARVLRDCSSVKRDRDSDPVTDMVAAIKVLGDGFVKMEQMKMDMAREIETMRMDMEMKRTEMILESQQRIVEAFAVTVSDKRRKAKRLASPES